MMARVGVSGKTFHHSPGAPGGSVTSREPSQA
jgi:hypothetical protein